MTRCVCKTTKGVQCKKTAIQGSKMCQFHKNCKSKTSKKTTKKVAKSPTWLKNLMFEPGTPEWLRSGNDKTKPLSPKKLSPKRGSDWWLQ